MSNKTRIIIFLVSIAMYVGAFMFMDMTFHKGQPTVWILPVLAAGWLFGLWPAVIVGLASLPVNALMLTMVVLLHRHTGETDAEKSRRVKG